MPGNRLLAVALVASSLAAVAAPARAFAQAADAQALIREGVDLRRNGDDVGALGRFQQAWQASHSSEALAQMALAEQALGQWVAADGHLREALATTGSAWIDRNRGALNTSLEIIAQHVGRLVVTGTPPGAEVRVNGRPAGTLPLAEPIRLLAETVRLEVAAPGFASVTRTIPIVAGVVSHEVVELEREAPAATSPSPDGAPGEHPATSAPAVALAPPTAPAVARGRLIVDASDENAMVSIDHRSYGAGHVEQTLPTGSHVVEIHASGYLPYRRTVTIDEMGLVRIDASLQRPQAPGWVAPVAIVAGIVVVGGGVAIGAVLLSHPRPLYVPTLGNVTEAIVH